MALVKTCPTCGAENLPASPFCSRCGVSIVAVAPAEALAPTNGAGEERLATKKVACPDCKADNEAGADRCVYCDCSLPPCSEPSATNAIELAWPWGRERLEQTMRIGREPPAPDNLIAAINSHGYDNISRSHAELRINPSQGEVLVVDLGSTNGTFVDGVRLPAHQPTLLKSGAVVRFAANLAVTVTISAPS